MSEFISSHMLESIADMNGFAPRDFPAPTKYVKRTH